MFVFEPVLGFVHFFKPMTLETEEAWYFIYFLNDIEIAGVPTRYSPHWVDTPGSLVFSFRNRHAFSTPNQYIIPTSRGTRTSDIIICVLKI